MVTRALDVTANSPANPVCIPQRHLCTRVKWASRQDISVSSDPVFVTGPGSANGLSPRG